MEKFNNKISKKGEYLPYNGFSTICIVNTDLKHIENFIKTNSVLSEYYSALPSKSYHMTVFNMISPINGIEKGLLKEFEKFNNALKCYNYPVYVKIISMKFDKTVTLFVEIIDSNIKEILKECRYKCSKICNHKDAKLVYHITLAYLYRNIEKNRLHDIQLEFKKIWDFVSQNPSLVLKFPRVYFFSDMTNYVSL